MRRKSADSPGRAYWVPAKPELVDEYGQKLAPGAAQVTVLETAELVILDTETDSSSVAIGNPTEIGLLVPTITAATLTVQVSNDDSDFFPLVDKDGAPTLVMASSTGGFALDGNALGGILSYRYFRVVSGAAQGEDRTLIAFRKLSRTDPLG